MPALAAIAALSMDSVTVTAPRSVALSSTGDDSPVHGVVTANADDIDDGVAAPISFVSDAGDVPAPPAQPGRRSDERIMVERAEAFALRALRCDSRNGGVWYVHGTAAAGQGALLAWVVFVWLCCVATRPLTVLRMVVRLGVVSVVCMRVGVCVHPCTCEGVLLSRCAACCRGVCVQADLWSVFELSRPQ